MHDLAFSPYACCAIEQPGETSPTYSVGNLLTGERVMVEAAVFESLQPGPLRHVRELAARELNGAPFWLDRRFLTGTGLNGAGASHPEVVERMLRAGVVRPRGGATLLSYADHYVLRPLASPALLYRDGAGSERLARLHIIAPSTQKRWPPDVVDEEPPRLAAAVFRLADGSKTLRQIVAQIDSRLLEAAGVQPDLVAAVDWLCDPDRQLVRFSTDWSLRPKHATHQLLRSERRRNGASNGQPASFEDTPDYYRRGVEAAMAQFDFVETTVNHAFRFPTSAFENRAYGARLWDRIVEVGLVTRPRANQPLRVLEIGGGTGRMAREFITAAHTWLGDESTLEYHIIELSPVLAGEQRAFLADAPASVHVHEQNAQSFDLRPLTFDLIVSNEVIADLPITHNATPGAQHTGVFDLLSRIHVHLAPYANAVLTEYGGEGREIREVHLKDHSEWSIDFSQVLNAARGMGFDAQLKTLASFLKLDGSVPMLHGGHTHILCLNHVVERLGFGHDHFPYAAMSWEQASKELSDSVSKGDLVGIATTRLMEGTHYGPAISSFKAMTLRHAPAQRSSAH